MNPVVRLDLFEPTADRGASRLTEGLWYITKFVFFLTAIPWPSGLKVSLLKAFGASMGVGVVIAPKVNIHMPWKLEVGDYSWIGQETFLLNLEPIAIGSHCCVSQRAFLCTGNHDYRSPTFDYSGQPIQVEEGAWIGASSFVGPGVTVGAGSVVTAGSVVLSSVEPGWVVGGNPATALRPKIGDPSSTDESEA